MRVNELIASINNGDYDKAVALLYPNKDICDRKARIITLANDFLELYGDLDVTLFSVPGRTELSGNHTDHNNGRVLAASVDIDIIAIAAKVEGDTVRIKS
ncbi:MAG: galactokinase family protein, partial [Clostridia bacterium]|nr:galactokinase family protein [Clostridia bacterium]